MRYYFAPMEGLTGSLFRRVHHELFPGADRYYTPFISPTGEHVFTARERREIFGDREYGVPLVPQLLTKNAGDFLWAAGALSDMGYEEVNLNLGCPSRTVTAKGKGSGLLRDPSELDRLLEEIFKGADGLRISVKTRIGVKDPEEWETLLAVYRQYPIYELTVHPRTAAEMYRGRANREVFRRIYGETELPLCYNGDIASPEEALALEEEYPRLRALMIGRAAISNPAFFRQLRGGKPLEREELRALYTQVYQGYRELFDRNIAMRKMKEFWSYTLDAFADSDKIRKKLARASDPEQFEFWSETALQELELRKN